MCHGKDYYEFMFEKTSVAIIIPVYNEANRWNDAYWQTLMKENVTLYFVNDGSIDNTASLAGSLPGSVILNLPNNVGKSEAVRMGMKEALRDGSHLQLIGFLDADGAFDVREVITILAQASRLLSSEFDALWSSRVKLAGRNIVRNVHRHQLGRLVSTFLATSFRGMPYDSQSGLKFYKVNDSLRKSLDYKSKTRWFFELEHFSNYQKVNGELLRIWEHPVETWRDVKGSKLYHFRSILIVGEVLLIWSLLRKTNKINNS